MMKKTIFAAFASAIFLFAGTVHAQEREFVADEGFQAGCEQGGFQGAFQFLRNGRIGTLKFPSTGAAFVLFQGNESDPYRWSVTNENDHLEMDFELGRLVYGYSAHGVSFSCEGGFSPN